MYSHIATSSFCRCTASLGPLLLLAIVCAAERRAVDSLRFRASALNIRRFPVEGTARSVAFSEDGALAAICQWDGAVIVRREGADRMFAGHSSVVLAASFASGNGTLLTGGGDGTARLWDLATGSQLRELKPNATAPWVVATALSQDDRAATGCNDGSAHIWDTVTGELLHELGLHELEEHSAAVLSVAFARDGRLLTMSADKTAQIWDRQGRLLHKLKGHTGWVTSGRFSPDGVLVLTSSHDHTARLWNASSGRRLRKLDHAGVLAVAFDPQGQLIATAGKDNGVHIWDVASGEPLRSLTDMGTLSAVTFAEAGQVLRVATLKDGVRKPSEGANLRAKCEKDCAAHDPSSGEQMPVFEL